MYVFIQYENSRSNNVCFYKGGGQNLYVFIQVDSRKVYKSIQKLGDYNSNTY